MLDGLRDRLRSFARPPAPQPLPKPPAPPPAPTPAAPRHASAAPPQPQRQASLSPAGHAGARAGADRTGSGVVDGVKVGVTGTADGLSVRGGIEKLNSAGDSTTLRLTPEAKVLGNIRAFKVGPKAQLGSTIEVRRDSDAPDSSYTVRYDKHSLLAAVGEAGTDAIKGAKGGKTGGAGGKAPGGVNLKAEAGVQGADVVEMRFKTRDEAIRAGETLQRLQRADLLDDAMDMAASAAPIPVRGEALSGGGDNPVANPLNRDGAPGRLSSKVAGVSPEDMTFLKDHVTAYETTIGSRTRLAAEVKGDLKLLDGALEGRVDGTQQISRRVEMPVDGKDGSVTYSVSSGLRLSAKERANRKATFAGADMLTLKADNRLELANARTTASLRYSFAADGQDPTRSAGGRPVPEADAMSGTNGGLKLERVAVENRLEWRDQGLTDPSRGDSNVVTERLELNDPTRLRAAAGQLFEGRFEDAARTAGARLDLRADTIERSGIDVQPGVKLDAVVLDVEATAIVTVGVNDVVGRRELTVQPGGPDQPGTPGGVEWRTPPAPADDGKTYAVQPYAGAVVRAAPEGEPRGVVQSGSFLRDAGGRRTAADGQAWMQVRGTDKDDKPVAGWVRADLLARHDSATGAMDATGRINPTAEYNRMDQIKVRKDDNLWNLAREHGWDFEATVAANKDHLENPSLIFKGDTVYVPGSARGPARERVETPAEPGKPGAPSVESRSQGRNGIDGSSVTPGASVTPGLPGGPVAPGASVTPGVPGGPGTPSGPTRAPTPANPSPAPAPSPDAAAPPAARPVAPAPGNDVPGRARLDDVLARYQTNADAGTADWKPRLLDSPLSGPADLGTRALDGLSGSNTNDQLRQLDRKGIPASEATALNRLGELQQMDWAKLTKATGTDAVAAFARPAGYRGDDSAWSNDGHVDAYRHALWNARMTKQFGAEWTREYATAHERLPENPGPREAMDLYNNEVGRKIATENPGASDADLQRLVRQAVDRGDLVVIDRSNRLAWSDRVKLGEHGNVPPGTAALPGNANHNAAPAQDRTGS
ncbi:LysM peptidoglycan-binding domain-containing protein [Paracoccus sphaerophysae]|uniref:LysM peptidoglycan-binding domain-containing protein n=1 Tax=Paracoccus sphaerophysae TaxID=690417 RepID=UPI00235A14C7|nr:LysM peptidoglycan-binding domain-containing protein [Paracoccus sphaerophysae]